MVMIKGFSLGEESPRQKRCGLIPGRWIIGILFTLKGEPRLLEKKKTPHVPRCGRSTLKEGGERGVLFTLRGMKTYELKEHLFK